MRNISVMYQIIDNKLHKLVWVLDEEDFRVNSEWWEKSSKTICLHMRKKDFNRT